LILLFLVVSIATTGTSIFLWSAIAEAQSIPAFLHRHHPFVRKAVEVQHRHHSRLMSIPEVVGTGVGIGADGLPVIKVFTRRAGIPRVPEMLEFIPVQAEATGMVVALGNTTARYRPSPIGVSTGHPAVTAGTIGARVIDADGKVYALSNNHVYADSNDAMSGDSALQPGTYDGGEDPTDSIGVLSDFEPIDFTPVGVNYMDAAIALSSTSDLDNFTLSDGYGIPSSQTAAATVGLPVKKYGRTTGLTQGLVSEINVSIEVCYEVTISGYCSKSAFFYDQIAIAPLTWWRKFSAGGDSGSLVVTQDGNNPVGLLFAGSSTRTFANRIDLVLTRFAVNIDDRSGIEPPDAPSDLTATPQSTSQVNLSWTDGASSEDGFKIERCTGAGCSNFAQIATVGANVTSYSNNGLSASTTYNYRVRAYNSGGDSAYSNTVSATTPAPALPAPPSNLTATPQSTSQVNLSWTDMANNEDGFKIERCLGAGCSNFAQIATVSSNVTSYPNNGLSASTAYSYRVRAYNSGGDSSYSNTASTTTPAAPTPPAAPGNLTAASASMNQINLSWTDNSTNEDGFKIERCSGVGCSNFAQIAVVSANVIGYLNNGLSASTAYSYRVRAYNSGGDSSYSNTASATTPAPPVPAAPGNLAATAVSTSQVNLSWTDGANNEDGFKIERCTDAGCSNFAQIATVGANVTSYSNNGLSASTAYSYRVRAYNSGGDSSYSNTASTTTLAAPALPAAPSNLATTSVSRNQINLSWTDNSTNEEGFKIERCQGSACTNFSQISTVGPGVTNFSNAISSSPLRRVTYRYRVRAYNSAGNSGYSNIVSATP
jgi:hypothetical protein